MTEIRDVEMDLQRAIDAARNCDWTGALIIFNRVYSSAIEDASAIERDKHVEGLSFYGLTLAMGQKKYKPAIDFCRKAANIQFYNTEHIINLAKVYLAAGMRKKAVDTLEAAMQSHPGDSMLIKYRREIGIRARPAIPFLPRENPLNVAIGKVRHVRKRNAKKK